MTSIQRALACTALLLSFGPVAGCSRAPKAEAPAPATEAAPASATPADTLAAEKEPEPATLADAEALLEKARAQLDHLALNDATPGSAGAAAPPAAAPAPAPKSEASRADKSAEEQRAQPSQARDEPSPCETACKAFSSLTRASDAVCRLDTDGGKRCERARRIREDASQRVASCGCAK